MNPEVIEYIRRNRHSYTREAITRQLLHAGYTPVEIAAAWRTVEGTHFSDNPSAVYAEGKDPRQARRFANSPRFWGIFIGFLLLSYLVPGLMVYASAVGSGQGGLANFGIVLFLALQALGLIVGTVNLDRDRPTGMGLLLGVLFTVVVVPFVVATALFGICLALVAR